MELYPIDAQQDLWKRLAPLAYEDQAHDALDRINLTPYFATYFGYKGHMDQNEKTA